MNSDVMQRIQPVIDDSTFGGTIGIVARNFDSGEEIMLQPDTIFPTASTFKTVFPKSRPVESLL